MSEPAENIRLTDDDIEFLVAILRSATDPVATQQLIEALRDHGE